MSNGVVRKVSLQDIQLVQNLIERCLQLYMSQREVVSTLLEHAKIEPGFTELVWQKLEAENQEFFRAYHMRLIVKDQILRFNQLLDRQVQLMRQMHQTGVSPIPLSNGTQMCSMHDLPYQAPRPAGPVIKAENMHQNIGTIHNVYTNGVSSLQQCMQGPVNLQNQAGTVDVPRNLGIARNSNPGMMQGANVMSVKQEGDYAGNSPFIFGMENNLVEVRNAIGDKLVSPFSGGESSSQTLNENMLDPEANTFGFLGQIPRNFSLSDLNADFSNNIIETYSRSPFLGAEANFPDPHCRGEQDTKRLDMISEGFSYRSD